MLRGHGGVVWRWLVACCVCVVSEIWSVGHGDGRVWRCVSVSVMLLRKCAAAILGVAALIACDVCGDVVVLVDVWRGD